MGASDNKMPGEADQDGTALAGALESEERKRERFEKLDALGQALAKSRSEAIDGRAQSGVEEDWREDNEFYEGVDDANRHEHRSVWHTKPMGQAAPSTTGGTTRSTVFPNITGPYVDAASARISDMLLPTDDRAWALKPTPIADLVGIAQGDVPEDMQKDAMQMHGGNEAAASEEIAKAINEAKRIVDEAQGKADKAQKRIEDWHVESQWHAHIRQVIEDAARIGTGVLKGPFPMMKRGVAFVQGALKVQNKLQPASRRIDPNNFYPDPNCGNNVQNGSYTWERDNLTRKQLRALRGQPGYIDEAIDLCLEEGPRKASSQWQDTGHGDQWRYENSSKAGKFEVWYYHGTLERADLEAGGCDCSGQDDPHLPAMITMVNNHVIRASLNPLDTGSFPYDVMVWRAKENHWTGIGVARQIRTPQRIVVAATRNLMDNAGLAAGPMLVLRQGVVYPADGVVGLGPRKVYYIGEDADEIADVKAAIGVIKVDMLVNELMEIIRLGLKFAEDVTGMPLLLQGQQGAAPDTVGGLQILNNNASAVLRRLARLFDDRVTEPHVRRYYEWLLQYGKDDEKGDYQIDARGSSALVERDIQNQEMAGVIKLSTDMRFGLDPRKAVHEYLKSRHLDPKSFEFDDEEWKKILEQMSKGPQDQALTIAQLKAEATERLAGFWANVEAQADQIDKMFQEQESAKDRTLAAVLAQMEQEGAQSISLDKIKAMLADTTIKVGAQERLSRMSAARQLLKPPTEPVGRAPKGKAFQA